jgi:CHASE2 domain-containing sensor protein
MKKLVDLRLDGDTESGFRVILTIREEANFTNPTMEITGYLPPSPELVEELQNHWQVKYRNLGAPYRIKPKKITYDGSVNKRIQECKESEQKLRFHLTNWLNSQAFIPINNRLREELSREETIRFLIRTENQQLQKLPWHLWEFFERYRNAEVAFSPVTFERPPKSIKTTGNRVKILAILGHSEGINTEADRLLLESLPNAEITFLVEKTRQEINEQLWGQPLDIIFFAGHSETEGEIGRIYINPQESLTLDELWYGLRKAVERGLKIAIFNSCDGLGLAQQLHDVQIPQMIVMRELVPDKVAQEFLKYFLTAFASGQSFYLAVREARERLQGMEGEFPCASWLPVICQNLAEVPPSWQDLFEESEVVVPESLPRRRRFRRRSLQKLLMVSMVVTCLVMGMRYLGLLESLELQTFDKMMQLRADEGRDERLLIVKVTKEDIEQLGDKYPLSDSMMLRLLKKLDEYKPKVIGIDIYRDREEGKGRADLIQYLQKSPQIILPCLYPSKNKKNSGIKPPDGILENQVGFVDVVKDSDDKVRRHLLSLDTIENFSCSTSSSLSYQLAYRYLKSSGHSLTLSKDYWQFDTIGFEVLKVHKGFYQQREKLRGHQIMLNYRYPIEGIAKQVTIKEILANIVPPNLIENKIILIGVTDQTLAKDEFNTPYNDEKIRGLLLQTQMVSQLISSVNKERLLLIFLPLWADVMWIWICSLVGGIIIWRFPQLLIQWLAIVSAIILLWGVSLIFLLQIGILIALIPSHLALIATTIIVGAFPFYKTRQQA